MGGIPKFSGINRALRTCTIVKQGLAESVAQKPILDVQELRDSIARFTLDFAEQRMLDGSHLR